MADLGLDVIRGYELSWLGATGKPEIACMELCIDRDLGSKLDTMALKEYLYTMCNRQYATTQLATREIETHIRDILGRDPLRLTFYTPHTFTTDNLTLKSTAQDYYINHNVRFNCQYTGQPFRGTVLVDFFGGSNANELLQQKIIAMRNSESNPQKYANALLLDDCVVSLHLARKGGLSWQLIRSRDPEVDLWSYVQRAAVE